MREICVGVAVVVLLPGCGPRESSPVEKNEPAAIFQKAEEKPAASLETVRQGVSTGQILVEAEVYAAAGQTERALALLDILEEKFPAAIEIEDAHQLRARIAAVGHKTQREKPVFSTPSDPRPAVVSPAQVSTGVITGMVGSGGAAGGMSLSAELDRMKNLWLYGAGIAWIQTSDVKKIYYVDSPSSDPGVTRLGDYNEGDEYELYGVLGRKIKDRLTACGSLGFSRQTIVNLEQNNATKTLYVASRVTESYLTFSGQVRYQVHNFITAILGYHTRRGAIGGVSIRW